MTGRQSAFLVGLGVVVLLVTVELVRRRRLREEYALLWILAAASAPVVVVAFPLIRRFTHLVGADKPVSILYLLAILFLLLVNMHFSARISALTNQVKELAQAHAIAHRQEPQPDDTAADAGSGSDGSQADRTASARRDGSTV